jgi:hypothetical protein
MEMALAEYQELITLRRNIHSNVMSLEVCWSCERVSECGHSFGHDGGAVWLCKECMDCSFSQPEQDLAVARFRLVT